LNMPEQMHNKHAGHAYSMAMKPMRAAAAAPPAMVREPAPLELPDEEELEPVLVA